MDKITHTYPTLKPIEFPEVNVRIAEDQPEYLTLPAHATEQGSLIFCLEASVEDIASLSRDGKLFIELFTFGQPMQPISVTTCDPFNPPAERLTSIEDLQD